MQVNALLQNRYRVLRPVGRGGMGTVYEAIDMRLNSTVALKETLLTDPISRRAFEREAQLLARLRHPALPKVIDHFSENDRQFLVMEFIAGDDLATLMEKRGGRFPPEEIPRWMLRWGDQLLDALDYLHKQNPPVFHRDIKPQNLKLSPRGDIILLDFGLAKGGITGMATLPGQPGALGFTPNYSPLEQIRGAEPDPRSDLYSLAATLYHMATGTRPVDALTRAAALLNDQPDPLLPANYYNAHISQEIAALLHQTLSPNVDDRPPSAVAMRRALYDARRAQGISTGPLNASDLPPAQQTQVVASEAVATTASRRATTDTLATHRVASPPTGYLSDRAPPVPPAPAAPTEPPGTLVRTISTGSPVLSMALTPDGRILVTGNDQGEMKFWLLADGSLIHTLKAHQDGILRLAYLPFGGLLMSGSEDKTARLWLAEPQHAEVTELYQVLPGYPVEALAISANGQRLAVGGWSDIVALHRFRDERLDLENEIYTGIMHCLAFSADGRLLAGGGYETTVGLWDVEQSNQINTLRGHSNVVQAVAFSPKGNVLASGGGDRDVLIWQVSDGRLLDRLHGHRNVIRALTFSADGELLASASEDRTVRVWRIRDTSLLYTLDGHTGGVTNVVFTPDQQYVITGSRDTKFRIWKV